MDTAPTGSQPGNECDLEQGDGEDGESGKPAVRVPRRVIPSTASPPEEEADQERAGVPEIDLRGGFVVPEETEEGADQGEAEDESHPVPWRTKTMASAREETTATPRQDRPSHRSG